MNLKSQNQHMISAFCFGFNRIELSILQKTILNWKTTLPKRCYKIIDFSLLALIKLQLISYLLQVKAVCKQQ